jgi:uncharacterized membrane protein YbhN (UPF0104 family)
MRLFSRPSLKVETGDSLFAGDGAREDEAEGANGVAGDYSSRAGSILIFVVVGVLLYASATVFADRTAVVAAFSALPWTTLAAALTFVILGWLLRGLRFHFYLATMGRPVPLGYAVRVFLASFALTGTPGKMGEAVKGIFLKRDFGVPYTSVMAALMVERLTDLLGVLLLASLSVMLFSEWMGAFLGCAALVIGGGAFLCVESLYRPLLERGASLRRIGWICTKALETLLIGRELMKPRMFFVGLALSTVSWGLEALCLDLVMNGMGLDASLLQANFVYSFSTLLGALSMLPGGIGGAEAGMVALMAVLGISYSRALPAVILIRVCTLWFAVFTGIVMTIPLIRNAPASKAAPQLP